MIKVHYCPSCGRFRPCPGACSGLLQVGQCSDCSSQGPPRNGSAYLAAVSGAWGDGTGPGPVGRIIMRLRDGTRYSLDPDGNVLARSDGPAGFAYSDWRILGFSRRWNSGRMVPLAAAISGEDTGHGYVMDLDHGHVRGWMCPDGHRLASLSLEVAQ